MMMASLNHWKKKLRLLPLLIVVAGVSFGVRISEVVQESTSISGPSSAMAETPDLAMGGSDQNNSEQNLTDEIGTDTDKDTMPPQTNTNINDWRDADDTEFEYSNVKMELFQDLAERRKQLDQQSRELSIREALLKTAEQEINQKYQELLSLRDEIQDLLKQQSEEEQKRIASLVKIYEGMKPKDAARIFNTLDMDVLLEVVSQMSERKSAPIIAAMSPDRARSLTMMLMEQKSLIDDEQNLLYP